MPSKSDYERFFKDADVDGSGNISFDELVTVLRKRGYRGTDKELRVGHGSLHGNISRSNVEAQVWRSYGWL